MGRLGSLGNQKRRRKCEYSVMRFPPHPCVRRSPLVFCNRPCNGINFVFFVKILVNFVVKIFYHKGHKGLHKEHKGNDVVCYI